MLSDQPIKLIYIVGTGNSGSTLLDLLLGSHSRIESGGEIFKFPDFFSLASQRAVDKQVCTCGVHVKDCGYWQRVWQQLHLGNSSINLDINTQHQKAFEERNLQLISALLALSGKAVFCDSSKGLGRLKRFLKSKFFDVTIVHLVRDGRAVSFSRQKKAARKANRSDRWSEYQDSYFKSLAAWKRENAKIYRRLSTDPRYYCLKYEELVADPHGKLTEILAPIDLKFEDQQLAFWQATHHNLSGNRMRLGLTPSTPRVIQRDTSYLENLPYSQWWMSNLYAFRELKMFGYPLLRQ